MSKRGKVNLSEGTVVVGDGANVGVTGDENTSSQRRVHK